MFKTIAVATIVAAVAGAADAATVNQYATPTTAIANPIAASVTGDYAENVTDTGVPNVRRSVWEDTPLFGSVYSSITGDVTFDFGSVRKALSLVWGSPDSYNSISFYLGGSLVDTVLGSALVPCCTTGQLNIATSLVKITGVSFDSIVLHSGQPAFEFANVEAAAVPVPAAGLMLLSGIGAVAALRRRRAA